MSILTVENDHLHNPIDSLMDKITYVEDADKTELRYLYGASVSALNAYDEMYLVKDAHDQIKRKGFYHITFDPENPIDIPVQSLYEAGVKIAEWISHFDGYRQVLMALHIKEEGRKNHLHFIVNNIDIDTGKRLDIDYSNLVELKSCVSQIAGAYGVEPIRRYSLIDASSQEVIIENESEELD